MKPGEGRPGTDHVGGTERRPAVKQPQIDPTGAGDPGDTLHDDDLLELYEEEVNTILGPPASPLIENEKITIVGHEYHNCLLQYLVHDDWDVAWIPHAQLKTNEPLLVATYVKQNKHLLTRCSSWLTSWADGVLEANNRSIQRLRSVTTSKSKKGRIRKVKYGHAIPNNPEDVEELDRENGNTLWKEAFELECTKLMAIDTFRAMTDSEWGSGEF